jgi:hypothetical protein
MTSQQIINILEEYVKPVAVDRKHVLDSFNEEIKL